MSTIEPEVTLRLVRNRQGSPDSSSYPIGVVSRRTGLPPATLRVWERRYGALEPARTPKGSRLYTEEQIEKLLLLRRVLAGGWRIGQVAGLDAGELQALAEESTPAEATATNDTKPLETDTDAATLRQEFLAAARRLDSDAMSRLLEDASVALSRARLFDRFLGPLLHDIGDQWAEGSLRPAHEHLATSTVRHWIEGLRPSLGPAGPASHLLVATPRGQLHELGALLVALCAEEVGWRVTYLGPNLPAEEIALAARELTVDAIALSLLHRAPQLTREMARLREQLGDELPIFLGGVGAANEAEHLEDLGFGLCQDLGEFRAQLRRLSLRTAVPGSV